MRFWKVGVIWFSLTFFFVFFQSYSLYAGDAGDLVTAAYTHGVAHPPGFPLYTFLGYALTKFPLLTVAWRVTFLSSLSASTALTVLFVFLNKLTKNPFISIISVLSLGTTYIFWLYAVVPEVFMFNILFQVCLFLFLYLWSSQKKDIYFFLFSLTAGLSLAHHPIIVFTIPAVIYWLSINKKLLKNRDKQFFVKSSIFFIIGLLPYIYIPIAAKTNAFVNWNNATTFSNFLRLITRADYGTFRSGPHAAQTITSRLLGISIIGNFYLLDFRPLGIFLMIVGAIYQFKIQRKIFYWLFIAFIFTGPVYFFYASYIFTDNFSIATLERFLLPSYVLLTVWLAYGMIVIIKTLSSRLPKFGFSVYFIFLLIPLSYFYINYPRISVLKYDKTSENYALDMFKTAPKNAILLTERDNALFNMQYVYVTQNPRPDIKMYHFYRLYIGELGDYSKKYFPDVVIPEGKGQKFVDAFIEANYKKFPIYSNTVIPLFSKDGYWIRTGLLLRYYKKGDFPPESDILKVNDTLWNSYHDPLSGSLGKHRNLMLTNILDFYAEAHVESAASYEGAGDLDKALAHYQAAMRLLPDDLKNYLRISKVYLSSNRCEDANTTMKNGFEKGLKGLEAYETMLSVQKKCYPKSSDVSFWQKFYDEVKKKQETPLKEL